MKRTLLLIVRHGETKWNKENKMMGISDIPLNPKGKRQARSIAAYLASYPVDIIFSSPLKRTVETAKTIIGKRKIPFVLQDSLKERDFGIIEGKTYEEVNAFGTPMIYNQSHLYPYFQPPKGERLLDVENRAKQFIEELSNHVGKNIVVVSHGSFLRVLTAQLLGFPLSQLPDVRFDNASLTIIELEENQTGRLHRLNITYHLV